MKNKEQKPETKAYPLVRNSLNYKQLRVYSEKVWPPSLTLPDRTLSINELIRRHLKGLPIPAIMKEPIYEDPALPSTGRSFSSLDLIDLSAYKKTVYERHQEATKKVNEIRSAREKYEQQRQQRQQEMEKFYEENKGKKEASDDAQKH